MFPQAAVQHNLLASSTGSLSSFSCVRQQLTYNCIIFRWFLFQNLASQFSFHPFDLMLNIFKCIFYYNSGRLPIQSQWFLVESNDACSGKKVIHSVYFYQREVRIAGFKYSCPNLFIKFDPKTFHQIVSIGDDLETFGPNELWFLNKWKFVVGLVMDFKQYRLLIVENVQQLLTIKSIGNTWDDVTVDHKLS